MERAGATGMMVAICCGMGLAQEASFEGLGQAPVQSGDRAKARGRALDEAVGRAVEQAAGTLLSAEALAARTSELKLRIYPKAKNYVLSYRILDEGEQPSGSYQVHILAQVSTGRLFHDLGRGPVGANTVSSRRALYCVEVRQVSDAPDGEMAGAVAALASNEKPALRKLLLTLDVEPRETPDCRESSLGPAAERESASGSIVLTAELAMTGTLRGSRAVGAHARTNLRLHAADGHVLAVHEREADGYGPEPLAAYSSALQSAFDEAVRELAPALILKWPTVGTGGVVKVRLSGLPAYSAYVAVVHTLQSVPGVGGVEPRRFDRDGVDLQVKTAARASELGKALERLLPASSGWRVRSTDVGGLSVEMAKDGAFPPESG
jgi:hypothetical protein